MSLYKSIANGLSSLFGPGDGNGDGNGKAGGAVRNLRAEPKLMENLLTWEPVGWDTALDHYRVLGVGRDGKEQLLGKTIFPFFRHDRLDPAGETWRYAVEIVDAAGGVSPRADAPQTSSIASVTVGAELARLGDFDRKDLEFKYAPKDYKKIVTAYPDQKVVAGPDASAGNVAYLLPGPGDKWAGNKAYTLEWTVDIPEPSGDIALALWLVDTTKLGGTLDVEINGFSRAVELPQGATKGSKVGDASGEKTSLKPVAIEFDLPAGTLKQGENTLVFTVSEGGWLAWDALGLFRKG